MSITHTHVFFSTEDADEVLGLMGNLAERRDGKGWMNLKPWVEEFPSTSVLQKIFSAKGPPIPEATWIPATEQKKKPLIPAQMGLRHYGGPKSAEKLKDEGVFVPPKWVLTQDHTKRGLIYELPADESPIIILDFMIDASAALAGIRTDDRWVADILEQVPRGQKNRKNPGNSEDKPN